MSDLKCCPFCGGEADVSLTNQHDKLFIVGCNTPMCYGNINHFTMSFVSKESAINTWNTRAPMANIVEKLEEAEKKGYELIGKPHMDSHVLFGWGCAMKTAIEIIREEGAKNDRS